MEHCLECARKKKEVPALQGSVFCQACQPVSTKPAVIQHGYFIPLQHEMRGELSFADEARDLYSSLGFSMGCKHDQCPEGESCQERYYKFAGRFDSVSVYQLEDGSIIRRVSLEDFFSPEFRVVVKDYPFT